MKLPKKFQNEYQRATHEDITYNVGDEIRSFGSRGTILKVSPTGAWVQFRGYEAEVFWEDMRLAAPVSKETKAHETNALPEHVRPTTKHPAPPGRGVVKLKELQRQARSDKECEAELLQERRHTMSKDAEIRTLEKQIDVLKNENEEIRLACPPEEKSTDTAISPEGKVVSEPHHIKTIGWKKRETFDWAWTRRDNMLIVAPKGKYYPDIEYDDIVLAMPYSMSIAQAATNAWKNNYTDSEYSLYQYMPKAEGVREHSIDANQTVHKITAAAAPSAEPVEMRRTDACRVEIAKIKGRETVRVIFTHHPSKQAILSVKKQGFRYYHEKESDLKYWGAFFSSDRLRFAKQFCGEDERMDDVQLPPNESDQESPRSEDKSFIDNHIIVASPHPTKFDTDEDRAYNKKWVEENLVITPIFETAKQRTGSQPIVQKDDVLDEHEHNGENETQEDANLDAAENSMNSIEALLREALNK